MARRLLLIRSSWQSWSKSHGDNVNATRSDNSVIQNHEGTIHSLDVCSRQLTLRVNSALADFVVPPDCLIRLNGERVKLRLLQPGDHATVAYSLVGSTAFVHSIQVNWLPRLALRQPEHGGLP